MTKDNMIKAIQDAEASAWLELAKYDLDNKPIVTTWEQEKAFAQNDLGHVKLLNQWYGIKLLMDSMNIDRPFGEKAEEAADINHAIWTRQQNAKGIYYDENGNKIA